MIIVQLTSMDQVYKGAMLFDDKFDRPLPYVFNSAQDAEAFLATCERVGTNIYPSMPADDLKSYVNLWHDAYKRDKAPAVGV